MKWRCFHCDETFTTVERAALHFGPRIYSDPACTIDAARLRELEAELARYREEDTDLHRALHAKDSARAQAVLRAEEEGYRRGLADGHRFPADAAAAAGATAKLDLREFRQGNWEHPDHKGRIVGWVIPNEAVERMKADAFCLPREVSEALGRLAAAHGVPASPVADLRGMAREAAMQAAHSALHTAAAGLAWYRDTFPDAVDGSDDEASDEIDAAIAALEASGVPGVTHA